MKNNIRLSLLLIFVFIATILYGFVNKLTAPRILSNEELLINGFYKLQEPIALSDFSLEREDGSFFTKSDLIDKFSESNNITVKDAERILDVIINEITVCIFR